jgi:hypothetical protein
MGANEMPSLGYRWGTLFLFLCALKTESVTPIFGHLTGGGL